MLTRLIIRNYAIIEEAELKFGPSFNVIIGETGAGKSIIMGALGLILGKRADTNVLFNEAEKCVVEASLDLKNYQLQSFFDDNDLDFEETTIIRREINPKGKSRAFINDVPVTLDVLRDLTTQLIDIHGQQETRELENDNFFIKVTDKLAGHRTLLESYQADLSRYKSLQKQIRQLKEEVVAFAKEYEFLKFQFEELDAVTLSEEYWKSINEEISVLQNAESIRQNLQASADLLSHGQVNIDDLLAETLRLLGQIAAFHPDLNSLSEHADELQINLRELNRSIASALHSTESDEGKLQDLLEEHSRISRLMQKHQTGEMADLISLHRTIGERLERFSFSEDKIEGLEQEAEAALKVVMAQGKELSQHRQKAAVPFMESVEELIREMGMPFAKVSLQFSERTQAGIDGLDDITLLFAPNKGSQLQSLDTVGSGGERSRLMLAIKSIIAREMALPTLIFDEIDTGISGEVALKVGQILRQLGHQHQVLTITHLAQIAAGGHSHFLVYKDHEQARSTTRIEGMDKDRTQLEIAKMLSGANPNQAAIDNAKTLIAGYN
jgi:DNA repair protein RecN (Recombination protein N)